jgi:SAM-dependent methyltransferase
MIHEILAHPSTKGMDIDAADTTSIRRRIIREKAFLRKLYAEWYGFLLESVPPIDGRILELGSGAGFLKDLNSGVITSEVFECDGVDMSLDACGRMPFGGGELSAILMTDVFHHLPDVRAFFRESARVVAGGGVVSMIEPWVTPWSRVIYGRLHHEPFNPDAREWKFDSSGPLSGANGALPWIVFERDREMFEMEFPEWTIESINLMMPVAYLFSGGVSMRSLCPGWGYPIIRFAENILRRFNRKIAMFSHITLRRA